MQKDRFISIVLVTTIACSTLAGCSHYKEPEPGGAATAELHASPGATIITLDEKKVDSGDVANTAQQTVRTAEGKHSVGVYTTGAKGAGEWTVPLMLEATHAYRFAASNPNALSLIVTDESTGKVLIGPSPAAVDSARATIHFQFSPGVESIDGYPVDRPKFWIGPFAPKVTSIVTPGEHDVVARSSFQNGGYAAWKFRFLFVGGHTYKFDAGMTTKLKITDETTGVKVSTGE